MGGLLNSMAQRINYRYIRKFSTCWVPDYRQPDSLAGKLSNPAKLPKTSVRYIGALSRFQYCPENEPALKLLVILSGPEPQRSLLEDKLVDEFYSYPGKVILVRGLPADRELPSFPQNVQAFNHVPASQLNDMICSAKIVIARCGYTTVMDLVKLKKRSILIPTPGQAEQEYLAKYLLSRKLAYTVSQNEFALGKALKDAEAFPFINFEASMQEYKPVLEEFVHTLQQKIKG